MEQVHFGCRIETGVPDYETTADLARQAEAVGYDSVWIRDHVAMPEVTADPNCLECFTTLAALARDTKRVQLGTLVVCTPWRNPALLAKMGATIDVLSGGRLILGLGAGSFGLRREFDRYGWQILPNADRIRSLGESIQIIRKMWTEDAPSFQGRYHRIQEAVCAPKPKQRPHPPIFVGASGEQFALRNAVRYGDGWNSAVMYDEYVQKVETVNRYCDEIGRDPATLVRSVNHVVIVDKPERAKERLEALVASKPGQPYLRRRTIAGGPEEVAERIRPFLALGANWFITYFWETDPGAQRDNIAAFGSEVLPLFRS
ncbi:MAG: TIGR03619 family F420-dependent LLM class oxidoreductase [Dehalococcoidia bacterium]